MKHNLANRVIIITGASSGIGAATAIEAARHDMRTVLAARRRDKLDHIAQLVSKLGPTPLIIPTDVTDTDQIQNLINLTMTTHNRIDALLVNAGRGSFSPVETLTNTTHRQIFETNYFSTVNTIQPVIPIMKKQHAGHILITSSIAARISPPYYAAYSATKAAQYALAQSLTLELEPDNIHVTSINPIVTSTEFFETSAILDNRDAPIPNKLDSVMQSPQHVARRIIKCLKKPRPCVWPARWSPYAAALFQLFPRLQNLALRRHARKIRKTYDL